MTLSIGSGRNKKASIQNNRGRARKIASVAAWIALPLSPFLLLALLGLTWLRSVCLTETIDTVNGLSGYDILVTETNCDFIGNSDHVQVHISHAGQNKRDVIFEYDPMESSPIPTFSADAAGNLLISIAAVATVFHQEHEWRGKAITYNIGKEYDPEPGPSPGER